MIRLLPFIILSILLFGGCVSEDDASEILLSSKLSGDTIYSKEKLRIDIYATSMESQLTRLRISTFDTETGNIMLKDSTFNSKELDYSYLYEAPLLESDTVKREVSIVVEDREGNSSSLIKRIVILKRDYLLKELSGITIWQTVGNGRPDGFSLALLRPIITSTADSADIDIFTFDDGSGKLSREWRTNTDVYFVRSNSFDYPKATASSVAAAYSASVGYHSITGINDGDIILLGRGAKAEGVVQVLFTVDDGSASRYYFNLKPME